MPQGDLPAGRAQHPLTQAQDEPGLLGHGDELARRNHAVLRMMPADQGLETHHLSCFQADLGLVTDLELVFPQGPAHVRFHLGALDGRTGHFLHVVLESAPSRFLGLEHGGIGIAQQGMGVMAILGIEADAYADTERELELLHMQRFPQCLLQTLHAVHGALRLLQGLHHHGKFITAKAGKGILFPYRASQPLGDLLQHLVAHGMTETVVDLLELIEVYIEHRKQLPAAADTAQGLLETVEEQLPVRQAREQIMIGQVLQVAGLLLQLQGLAPDQGAEQQHQGKKSQPHHGGQNQHPSDPVRHGSPFFQGLEPAFHGTVIDRVLVGLPFAYIGVQGIQQGLLAGRGGEYQQGGVDQDAGGLELELPCMASAVVGIHQAGIHPTDAHQAEHVAEGIHFMKVGLHSQPPRLLRQGPVLDTALDHRQPLAIQLLQAGDVSTLLYIDHRPA